MNKVHFVFRGSAEVGGNISGAINMLDKMQETGEAVLATGNLARNVRSQVLDHFRMQIANAKAAIQANKAIFP